MVLCCWVMMIIINIINGIIIIDINFIVRFVCLFIGIGLYEAYMNHNLKYNAVKNKNKTTNKQDEANRASNTIFVLEYFIPKGLETCTEVFLIRYLLILCYADCVNCSQSNRSETFPPIDSGPFVTDFCTGSQIFSSGERLLGQTL